ncbi:MAG: CAP domain-containing protein, partial [Gemmatimonadota bacterium]|nr:CAP domain-containing protein [Gemmatimonadota bacterium]
MFAAGLLLAPVERPTAADPPAPDWDRLARGILSETNRVRRDPEGYARLLEQMLPRFDGTLLDRPGRRALRTEEGARAVREAVRALRDTRAMGGLVWSKGMAAGARDHVRDQGPTGGMEHRGRDGSSPAQRVTRYGRWHAGVAEN